MPLAKFTNWVLIVTSSMLLSHSATAQPTTRVTRLAYVGDTITQGYGIANPGMNAYLGQLAKRLGDGWQIGNFVLSGTTAMRLGDSPYDKTNEYRAALAFKPDVVVVALGTNDSKPQNIGKSPQDLVPSYAALIASFREANPKARIFVCLPPPAFPANFDITQQVISNETLPRLRAVAKESAATLIDLHTPLLDRPGLFADKVHPNQQGTEVLAELVSKAILNPQNGMQGSVSDFARRAHRGEPITVAFFGGSLTWGANATDPQRTSYRALMSQYLRERYPKTSFTFIDAAIGGTGSKLGMFRLERDVLAYNPDLVFLEFTANDGLSNADEGTMASYERLLRELVERRIAVVQVIFGFKWNFGTDWAPEKFLRREAHLKLSAAYGTAVGDALPFVQQRLASGTSIETLWPIDGAHPDDAGYRLFFEAVRAGFEKAVSDGRQAAAPVGPVFEDRYPLRQRIRLLDRPLPSGWKRSKSFRTSMWFDGLPGRWIGDVATCGVTDVDQAEPLRITFEGTMVGILGEADENGLSYIATIDGQIIKPTDKHVADGDAWSLSPARYKSGDGCLLMWQELSDKLSLGRHELTIRPVAPSARASRSAGQLRIESICVAGPRR